MEEHNTDLKRLYWKALNTVTSDKESDTKYLCVHLEMELRAMCLLNSGQKRLWEENIDAEFKSRGKKSI